MIAQNFQNFSLNLSNGVGMTSGSGQLKAAAGLGKNFQSVLNSLMSAVPSAKGVGVQNMMSLMNISDLSGQQGKDLVATLADAVKQENGAIPAGRFVGKEGIDALQGLLESMGYDKDKTADFIKGLKADAGDKDIPLSGVLGKLGEFVKQNDSPDSLEISALPFMESWLNSLGLNSARVESIMNKAVADGKEIRLDTLASELKGAGAESGDAALKTAGAIIGSVAAQGNESAGSGDAGRGRLTLDQFVTKLESLADKKHAKASAKSSEAGVDSLNEKDGDPSRVFFAQSFGKNIQNGKKGPVADSVPKTLKTDGQDTSSTSPAMTFDSRKVTDGELARKFSANTEDAGKAMMDRKGEADKAAEKELTGSFAKVLKETSGSAKSSDESSITRPLSATDLYGKVADLKTASTASASDKTLPAYVTDQVAKQISKAVKNGDTEIRFHIKPPDMGKVQLSIASTKDGLKIHIMAEHQSTRDMIMSQTSDLKTLLADQGIRLEKIDVGLSGDFGQSLAQARQETDNSGRERKNKEKPAFQIDGIAENSVGTPETVPLRYTRGNLDLVA